MKDLNLFSKEDQLRNSEKRVCALKKNLFLKKPCTRKSNIYTRKLLYIVKILNCSKRDTQTYTGTPKTFKV